MKNIIFQYFVRGFAEQVVKQAYLGVLGRHPDSNGLCAYSNSLRKDLDLSSFLADLAGSTEHWQQLLAAHSDDLVRAFYHALLGREPDAEALQNYVSQLAETHDLKSLLKEIAYSNEHWEKSIGVRSKDLVCAIYRGLLGREPDPEALENYAATLADAHDLGPLLSEIGRSDEHWEKSISARSTDLVRTIYRGLLGREPNADVLESYTVKLAGTHDLGALLSDICSTNEYKELHSAFGNHAVDLIHSVYLGLLSRPADASGIAAYKKNLKKADDFAQMISIILNSDEFKYGYEKNNKKKMESATYYWGRWVDRIDVLYHHYHDKPISNTELAQYIGENEPVWKIHRSLHMGTPIKNDRPRVLIFGAYGNGNMGDVYQAVAVRAHLNLCFGGGGVEIFACSLLKSSYYPFPENNKLPSRAIYDSDLINSFDYLVIGGGGLLAHTHDPLPDDNWAMSIQTPIILLGVGASMQQIAQHRALLENAIYVSARDSVSLAAIGSVRNDVIYAPDPILSVTSFDFLTEFDSPSKLIEKNIDTLWILKYPSNDNDKIILASIREIILNDRDNVHEIVAIEPKLDRVLDDYMQGCQVSYIETLSDLSSYIENSESVFSMRYHGVIFSLLMGRRVFGSSQSKIRELFFELDRADAYIESSEQISALWKNEGATASKDWLNKVQLAFRDALISSKLLSLT